MSAFFPKIFKPRVGDDVEGCRSERGPDEALEVDEVRGADGQGEDPPADCQETCRNGLQKHYAHRVHFGL